jgi:fructose-1,6-bisphosphatase
MALITFNIRADRSDIRKLLSHQKFIIEQLLEIKNNMATKAEFQQALADVTSALDNIAADITRLTDQLATGNLSDADEQEVFDQLRAVADRARTIADTTVDPEVPPTEPETPTEETPA